MYVGPYVHDACICSVEIETNILETINSSYSVRSTKFTSDLYKSTVP